MVLLFLEFVGWNASFVECTKPGVSYPQFIRVSTHLSYLLLFLLLCIFLLLQLVFDLFLSLLNQNLLGFVLPHRRLSNLLVLDPHVQINHIIIPKLIAELQDLLEI